MHDSAGLKAIGLINRMIGCTVTVGLLVSARTEVGIELQINIKQTRADLSLKRFEINL